MKQELDKCVLVIDEAMPRGLAANTAAILGITWGRLRPELVGEDVTDAAGAIHPGIIRTPVPVLSGRPETFQTWRLWTSQIWPRAAVPTASSSKKWPAPGRGSCDTWAWPFWAPGIRWTG